MDSTEAVLGVRTRTVAQADAHGAYRLLPEPRVLTNGVFDLLHRGHCLLLERARALGASLTVAINSDDSVRSLGKGHGRPFNTATDRGFVLASLAAVDLVVVFDGPKPVELIRQLQPDIYVKGADYDVDCLEESHWVRSWGGQALALSYSKGYSSTALAERITRAGMQARPVHS